MSKLYDEYTTTHVTFNIPLTEVHADVWGGTFGIVLFTGKHVWVEASYMHLGDGEKELGIKQCGCGDYEAFGSHGECIVAVPAELVREYLTIEEAEGIERMIDADSKLLSYAR